MEGNAYKYNVLINDYVIDKIIAGKKAASITSMTTDNHIQLVFLAQIWGSLNYKCRANHKIELKK
jgi:hypothetical protein